MDLTSATTKELADELAKRVEVTDYTVQKLLGVSNS
jgi:predicted transcriptional regulator